MTKTVRRARSAARPARLALIMCAACIPAFFAAAHPPPATLETPAITVSGPLADPEESQGLSGAACNGHQVCLTISDEMRHARFFTLRGGVFAPARSLFLLPATDEEADGEGVAFAGGYFYVAGSHSQTKSGAREESRHYLYRIPIDPPSPPSADLGTPAAPFSAIQRVSLDSIIRAHPLLSRYETDAPGETRGGLFSHGISIEGIAVADGTMSVGFRGPVDDDGAVILRFRADDLFAGTAVAPETHRVLLGGGQGVRDLAAVRGGLIILAGPETRLAAPNPQLFFWSGSRLVRLGEIRGLAGIPETITVLEETDDAYRILVLQEGAADGAPIIVRVAKPPPETDDD